MHQLQLQLFVLNLNDVNKIIEYFKSQIGKIIKHSSSVVAMRLKPVLKEVH